MSSLRAEAQRNHDRVLVAAAEAFAEHGPDISADEIARRAGVGHGTVYRRFPSKDALIAAVVSVRLGELSDGAEALLAETDAGTAFERFVWDVAELFAVDRGLCEGIPRCSEMAEVAAAKERLHGLVEQFVTRAQAEGSLRSDIHPDDVPILVSSAIMGAANSADRDSWRRYVAVVLDGLRPARI
jgi:AcrR family transcriptional regulator